MSANDPKRTYRLTDWYATAVLRTEYSVEIPESWSALVQLPCRFLPISGFIVSPSATARSEESLRSLWNCHSCGCRCYDDPVEHWGVCAWAHRVHRVLPRHCVCHSRASTS